MKGGTGDLTLLRSSLDGALAAPGTPSQTAYQQVETVIDGVRALVAAGRAEDAVELAEHVVDRLLDSARRLPERSDALRILAQRALDEHLRAAGDSAVDPVRLADWLLRLQLDNPEGPDVRLSSYLPVLGVSGLSGYRAAVEGVLDELPTIQIGQSGRYDRRRVAVLRIAEALAGSISDVELEVVVLAKDLSTGWQYLRIASALQEAGRPSEALAWVERGLAATNGRGAAARLMDLAVEECQRQGWLDRAVMLRRAAFEQRPSLDTYLRLRSSADHAEQWPQHRDWAHEWLASPVQDVEVAVHRNSVLVRVLLWEGDDEAAWKAAQERGCTDEVWPVLAEQRAATNPGEAMAVYRRLVERHLSLPGKEHDQHVLDLLRQLRALAAEIGQPDTFTRYLDRIKSRHNADAELLDEIRDHGL